MKQQKMLDQMAAVTEAQYLREHAKIKPILDAEAQLRSQLSKLDNQVKAAKAQAEQDHSIKALGADILWEGWHTRTRRQLNIELAQVTAQKLVAMDKLRKSFGRKTAVAEMATAERRKTKAARQKALQDRLLNL